MIAKCLTIALMRLDSMCFTERKGNPKDHLPTSPNEHCSFEKNARTFDTVSKVLNLFLLDLTNQIINLGIWAGSDFLKRLLYHMLFAVPVISTIFNPFWEVRVIKRELNFGC